MAVRNHLTGAHGRGRLVRCGWGLGRGELAVEPRFERRFQEQHPTSDFDSSDGFTGLGVTFERLRREFGEPGGLGAGQRDGFEGFGLRSGGEKSGHDSFLMGFPHDCGGHEGSLDGKTENRELFRFVPLCSGKETKKALTIQG